MLTHNDATVAISGLHASFGIVSPQTVPQMSNYFCLSCVFLCQIERPLPLVI